jgi:hypothetical protein
VMNSERGGDDLEKTRTKKRDGDDKGMKSGNLDSDRPREP